MAESAVDIYAVAFLARDRHELEELRGKARVRSLLTDDSGYDELDAGAGSARWEVVMAFDAAPRCNEHLRGRPGWNEIGTELAMVLRDIAAAPDAALPDGLELRPVDRFASGTPGSVGPRDAAAAAVAADPGITDSPEEVAGFLSTLPASVSVFAAVDGEDLARATSASRVFGEYAEVFFVSTEPDWRRRGIGRAMTLAALRAAAALGARRAFLHSTEDGASVYTRLGFEPAGLVTRYERAD